jgi:hypothetical protein
MYSLPYRLVVLLARTMEHGKVGLSTYIFCRRGEVLNQSLLSGIARPAS